MMSRHLFFQTLRTTTPLACSPSLLLGLVAAIGGLAAGCGTDGATTGTDRQDGALITPTDNEDWGNFTVTLAAKSITTEPVDLRVDQQVTVLDRATRLQPGLHQVSVDGVSSTFEVAPRSNRTMVLPIARVICDAPPSVSTAPADFGPNPKLAAETCPQTATGTFTGEISYKASSRLYFYASDTCAPSSFIGMLYPYMPSQCGPNGWAGSVRIDLGECIDLKDMKAPEFCERTAHATPFPLPATKDVRVSPSYRAYMPSIEYSMPAPGRKFRMAEGAVSDLRVPLHVLGTVPGMFSVNVHYVGPRERPNPAYSHQYLTATCGGDSYQLPEGTTDSVLGRRAYAYSGCNYYLWDLKRADYCTAVLDPTKTNEVWLYRIDVANVIVTREDNSTYTVPGQYVVYRDGRQIAGPYPTESGIDVTSGTYEVRVFYETADGPQHRTFTVKY